MRIAPLHLVDHRIQENEYYTAMLHDDYEIHPHVKTMKSWTPVSID
jgi:hypothetical protein